jgi:propanol-preferring alcohol dehydrogenase
VNARFTGYHEDGGYADYAVVDEAFAYPLPDEVGDLEAAPLLCAGLIGYRALQRTGLPPGGRLLLIGFGSSAHIVIQLALRRGHSVYVVTRDEGHRRLCRSLGATWAGGDFEGLPAKVDGAILFAPAGELVPPALAALERGGILTLAGIHLTDVPALNYERELFYEREVRSVTANTRDDGRALLREAVAAGVRPHVSTYGLEQANQALADLKHDRIAGTGVLVVSLEPLYSG